MLKINLGSCDNLMSDYLNVDRHDFSRPGFEFMQCDLARPWLWDTSSVDELRAHDIAEHISHPQGKLWFWNEAYRVLRPGGMLSLIVPTTDGRGAYQDPTHVTWWTPNDLFYVCEHWEEWKRFRKPYGISAQFRVKGAAPGFDGRAEAWGNIIHGNAEYPGHHEVANKVWKLHVLLEAVK